jgi:hypothetical protein
VGRITGRDIVPQPLPQRVGQIMIFGKALFVDINFPTDAAAVAAGAGNAPELGVVIGISSQHGYSPFGFMIAWLLPLCNNFLFTKTNIRAIISSNICLIFEVICHGNAGKTDDFGRCRQI